MKKEEEDKIVYKTNEFQTPITQSYLDQFPKEVQDQFFDLINSVGFIQRLISPDRKRAKDLKRDKEGKIIVDVCDPHILEDMDYFRPTALHFLKHGKLTNLRPNANPNSPYYKWLKEEVRRIWYGMVRPSDGEWVTGEMYFYLNYMPMRLTEKIEGRKNAYNRIVSLPRVWEGIYLWFHYLYQARFGGIYDEKGGNHAVQVATRGASKSYSCASSLARLFVCGDNEDTQKEVVGIIMAALKETLTKDGTLNKFEGCLDFCAEYTEFPSQRLLSSLDKMNWEMGYIDPSDNQTKKGTRNSTLGVTTNANAEKARGKRATKIIYEEIGNFPKFLDTWSTNEPSVQDGNAVWGQMVGIGCVCKGTKVYTKEGKEINIEDLTKDMGIVGFKDSKANIEPITYIQGEHYKDCVEIITDLETLQCSEDHPILTRSIYRPRIENNPNRRERIYYLDFKLPTKLRSSDYIAVIDKINVYGKDTLEDPYYTGYNTLEMLPTNYETLTYNDTINLLAGLFDSDGCVYYGDKDSCIHIVQCNKEILIQIQKLLRKLGVFSNINIKHPTDNLIDKNDYYELRIRDKKSLYNFVTQIPLRVKYKIENASKIEHFSQIHKSKDLDIQYDNIRLSRVKQIRYLGKQRIYNLTANDSHTYLANNIITHNTGGTEGSNFYGILEMLYNPIGYQIYPLPNYYDKNTFGKGKTVFFFGAYLNREGHYNKDGVSDVVATIFEILMNRYRVKYNSTDPTRLTRVIAERPLTIQEAIMKRDSKIFPTAQLNERLQQIDSEASFFNDVYTGRMTIKDGKAEFVPTHDLPIRNFPHKGEDLTGCIEIFELPKKDKNGRINGHRYIAGTDPVDDDSMSTDLSLQSTFIYDTWTEEIVAEYTGRPPMADDYYEQIRLLLLYYNAVNNYENNKKGLYGYFVRKNSTFLLADNLEFLKDKDLIRGTKIGNQVKGYTATTAINNYALRLIRKWLLETVTIVKQEGEEVITIEVPRLYTLKSRALIQELIQWTKEGNFDRVSAFGALMLIREDRLILYQGDLTKSRDNQLNNVNYLGNDDFFKLNYKE